MLCCVFRVVCAFFFAVSRRGVVWCGVVFLCCVVLCCLVLCKNTRVVLCCVVAVLCCVAALRVILCCVVLCCELCCKLCCIVSITYSRVPICTCSCNSATYRPAPATSTRKNSRTQQSCGHSELWYKKRLDAFAWIHASADRLVKIFVIDTRAHPWEPMLFIHTCITSEHIGEMFLRWKMLTGIAVQYCLSDRQRGKRGSRSPKSVTVYFFMSYHHARSLCLTLSMWKLPLRMQCDGSCSRRFSWQIINTFARTWVLNHCTYCLGGNSCYWQSFLPRQ